MASLEQHGEVSVVTSPSLVGCEQAADPAPGTPEYHLALGCSVPPKLRFVENFYNLGKEKHHCVPSIVRFFSLFFFFLP